ncbi:MAG: hypothetical protein I3274_07715 [Candidatus Moeniiplasma glomeromycotorum]|nr:hypothetical protein [Candidatus Moeniiplasma glomeromycotorum]
MSVENNFKRCSKCYQTYSGLKATCSVPNCSHEHFFKKDGKLLCVTCLMGQGGLKCEKCRKIITRLEELGRWKGNSVLVDDHTYDLNTFVCECRECNHSENKKSKLKRCQGTFSVHYNGGLGHGGATQYNQCDFAIPADGEDFCHLCKGQTEIYQQLRARLDKEQEWEFEKFCRAATKAQSYWNSLSSSEREKECVRLVEDLKAGKLEGGQRWRGNKDMEGYGAGWTHDGSFWQIKNGKYVSNSPHLVPVDITEEFYEKMFGNSDALVLRDFQIITKKDNNGSQDNSPSPNPAVPQPITNSDSKSDNFSKNKNDNLVNPSNSPQPNPGKDNSSETKNNVKVIGFENKENDNKDKPNNSVGKSPAKNDNKALIIDLKNVKWISLTDDGSLIIEFKNEKSENSSEIGAIRKITAGEINNSQELKKVKDYFQETGKNNLSQKELAKIFSKSKGSDNSVSVEKSKNNNIIFVIGGVIGIVLIIGIGIGLLLKRRRVKKKI